MQDGYYDHNRAEALDLLPTGPQHVLDIGCGRGGVTRELKRRFPGVSSVGLDMFLDPKHDYAATSAGLSLIPISDAMAICGWASILTRARL